MPTTRNPHTQESYKQGLLEVNKYEDNYDKLFDEKLEAQYKEFRDIKERAEQTRKFLRVFIIIIIIIMLTLLLLSYA